MLILGPGHVILTVHVSPVYVCWKIFRLKEVPSMWNILLLTTSECSSLNTTTFFGLWEEVLRNISSFPFRLREGVNSVVIKTTVFFMLSSDVLNTFSPSVLRDSVSTLAFDGNVVDTSANSEETSFTPVSTP
jgi:hypothetical protein